MDSLLLSVLRQEERVRPPAKSNGPIDGMCHITDQVWGSWV